MDTQRHMTSVFLLCGDEILLLYRQGGRVVNNVWIAAAGGHMEPHELGDARACVLREMKEELGLGAEDVAGLALRYITMRRAKDGEIRVNYYYFARLAEKPALKSSEGRLEWFPLEETSKLESAFAVHHVLEHYIRCGQFDRLLYGGIADGARMVMTPMPEF